MALALPSPLTLQPLTLPSSPEPETPTLLASILFNFCRLDPSLLFLFMALTPLSGSSPLLCSLGEGDTQLSLFSGAGYWDQGP